MKVLLTQPVISFIHEPPCIPDLGLGYIAARLKKKGFEVYLRDWNMNPAVHDFRAWLAENQPDVVGLKIFTKDVAAAQKTIAVVRDTIPQSIIVIGGPHPSCSKASDLMREFPECDFAFRGEAEFSFPKLLSALERLGDKQDFHSSADIHDIPGLVWREDGIAKSNSFARVGDLDSIGLPAWEMMAPNTYSQKRATAPIITTRGCPGKCSFCSVHLISGRKIRFRSPENVFEEIRLLYDKYNVRNFMFVDNCFTADKTNLIQLCRSIIDSGIKIEWDCNVYEKLDNLSEDVISLMRKAGCCLVLMGVESASEQIRRDMNKSVSLRDYAEMIERLKKHHIGVGTYFMIGFPNETYNDMKKTIQWAFSMDADLITFTVCFPIPGSQVFDSLKHMYQVETINWAKFNIMRSKYPLSNLASVELVLLIKMLRARIRLHRGMRRLRLFFS